MGVTCQYFESVVFLITHFIPLTLSIQPRWKGVLQ